MKERVTKLFIPFLIGTLTMGPFMKYVELKAIGPQGFHESFWEFLPTFFTRLDRFNWGHLWFLIYLFTFTILYLPVFLRLKASMGRWISDMTEAAFPIYLLHQPVIIAIGYYVIRFSCGMKAKSRQGFPG